MGKGTQAQLEAMAKADPDSKIEASLYDFYIAENLEKWEKRKTLCGNGQCPVLPQIASGAPKVKFWIQGPKVKGNKEVPRGTIIAAGWNDKGEYPNKSHGNHAAVYLEQNADGLVVLDQWKSKDVTKYGLKRTLRFGAAKKHGIEDDGDYFYVVLTRKMITLLWRSGEDYVVMG